MSKPVFTHLVWSHACHSVYIICSYQSILLITWKTNPEKAWLHFVLFCMQWWFSIVSGLECNWGHVGLWVFVMWRPLVHQGLWLCWCGDPDPVCFFVPGFHSTHIPLGNMDTMCMLLLTLTQIPFSLWVPLPPYSISPLMHHHSCSNSLGPLVAICGSTPFSHVAWSNPRRNFYPQLW